MTTLITGASSGIGREFAHRFAAEGNELALVARSADKLDALAAELEQRHGVEVHTIPLDLSCPTAAEQLWEATTQAGLEINVLVNNAGFATHGNVADADPARLAEQIQLNCVTLVGTTTRYLPKMISRGRGTIINIASTAAFQPIPHMAVYGASKSFVLSFTEALWAEAKDAGVRILAVCPGATDTAFFEVAGEAAAAGTKRTTSQLLDSTMRALRSGKPSVVDGFGNAFVARALTRLVPKRGIISIAERSVRPAQ